MGARQLFGGQGAFAEYQGELVVHGKLIGGVPKDPDTIRKWLEARLEMDDRALIEVMEETTAAMVEEQGRRPSTDELLDAAVAKAASGNGFKRIEGQLVYEGRCLKAGLKEAANVAFPGTAFPGKPKELRKGLMRYMAERVFVTDDYIPLGVVEPSGQEERIKHIMTPQGPRSALNLVDYVESPKLSFTIRVLDDCLLPEVWGRVWEVLEEIGIGADRARSDGRFELLRWDRIN